MPAKPREQRIQHFPLGMKRAAKELGGSRVAHETLLKTRNFLNSTKMAIPFLRACGISKTGEFNPMRVRYRTIIARAQKLGLKPSQLIGCLNLVFGLPPKTREKLKVVAAKAETPLLAHANHVLDLHSFIQLAETIKKGEKPPETFFFNHPPPGVKIRMEKDIRKTSKLESGLLKPQLGKLRIEAKKLSIAGKATKENIERLIAELREESIREAKQELEAYKKTRNLSVEEARKLLTSGF